MKNLKLNITTTTLLKLRIIYKRAITRLPKTPPCVPDSQGYHRTWRLRKWVIFMDLTLLTPKICNGAAARSWGKAGGQRDSVISVTARGGSDVTEMTL